MKSQTKEKFPYEQLVEILYKRLTTKDENELMKEVSNFGYSSLEDVIKLLLKKNNANLHIDLIKNISAHGLNVSLITLLVIAGYGNLAEDYTSQFKINPDHLLQGYVRLSNKVKIQQILENGADPYLKIRLEAKQNDEIDWENMNDEEKKDVLYGYSYGGHEDKMSKVLAKLQNNTKERIDLLAQELKEVHAQSNLLNLQLKFYSEAWVKKTKQKEEEIEKENQKIEENTHLNEENIHLIEENIHLIEENIQEINEKKKDLETYQKEIETKVSEELKQCQFELKENVTIALRGLILGNGKEETIQSLLKDNQAIDYEVISAYAEAGNKEGVDSLLLSLTNSEASPLALYLPFICFGFAKNGNLNMAYQYIENAKSLDISENNLKEIIEEAMLEITRGLIAGSHFDELMKHQEGYNPPNLQLIKYLIRAKHFHLLKDYTKDKKDFKTIAIFYDDFKIIDTSATLIYILTLHSDQTKLQQCIINHVKKAKMYNERELKNIIDKSEKVISLIKKRNLNFFQALLYLKVWGQKSNIVFLMHYNIFKDNLNKPLTDYLFSQINDISVSDARKIIQAFLNKTPKLEDRLNPKLENKLNRSNKRKLNMFNNEQPANSEGIRISPKKHPKN